MHDHQTVIVGAGIAGLACARTLCDAGAEFAVVSEDVGGRIRRSRDGSLNLGAYYVMDDYRHVRRFVKRGREISMLGSRVHDAGRSYTARSWRTFTLLGQSLRMRRLLREFREHYEVFKRACETRSQAQALRADPWLWELYRTRAIDLIREHRIEGFARTFAAPGLHGSTFLPLERLSAFVFLQFTLPMIVPIHEFTLRRNVLLAGFEERIQRGSVTRLRREAGGYVLDLAGGGALRARNVVLATPIQVSRSLLDLGPVKAPVSAHMFQVKGELLPPYAREPIHLFGQDDPTLGLARQEDGTVLFCSREENPRLESYFAEHRVVEHLHWDPAFHLEGDVLLECEQGENLYLIGDANVCGLEDFFITGLYAANRILGKAYS